MRIKFAFLILTILVGCSSNKVAQKSPKEKRAELYYSQGTSNLIKKDYTQALIHLKKADELQPNDSKVLNNLAMAYYFKGDHTKAFNYLKKSIKVNPKNSDARNNLASLLVSNGQLKLARKQYLLVLKDLEYKHQYRTYYNLASISQKLGSPAQAITLLKKSLEEKRDYCPAHFQIGVTFYQSSRYLEALKSFKDSATGTCAKNPAPRFYQGLSYISLNRPDRALLKFKEVIEHFPTSSYALLSRKKLQELDFGTIQASRDSSQTGSL